MATTKITNTKDPVVICFDIETTAGLYYAWRLGEQKINWKQIKKEPVVCCVCWSINGGKVQSLTFDTRKYFINDYDDDSDKELVRKFVDILNTADLIIAHNSPFDVGFLRSRIIKHKLTDIAPVLVDDTYLKSKRIGTQSHTLDYLLRYLGIGQKREHEGLEMWKKVMHTDKKALAEMVKYCKDDVLGLHKLYVYLKPYIKSSLNLAVFYGKPDVCPDCSGEDTLQKRGFHRTSVGKYQRYQCTSCGWWGHSGTNLISKKESGVASSKYNR